MAVFMWSLPHFVIPGGAVYRPPVASVVLLLWAVFAVLRPDILHLRISDSSVVRRWMMVFFGYCVLSTAYGYWNMSEQNRLTLYLTTDDVGYLGVASQRLFQLALVILAFETVRLSRIPAVELMRLWLMGTTFAIAVHLLTYIISSDSLTQRAGLFTEGNLGGLYYLISVFVAREYSRRGHRRVGLALAWLSAAGIVMASSSAAVLLLAFTLSAAYVLNADGAGARLRRAILTIGTVVSIGAVMYGTGSDFGITEKLFEEEVTSKSFSRIDRLASIETAIDLFYRSPWLGQGLQTYGFLANDYIDGPLLNVYDHSFRRIPNNIYAELAAETGSVGLLLFGGFMVAMVRCIAVSQADKGRNLLGAIVAILGYWLAFPTYSVVFVWVFFGLAMATLRAGPMPTIPQPKTRRKTAIPPTSPATSASLTKSNP
jgi:hypothetical protein